MPLVLRTTYTAEPERRTSGIWVGSTRDDAQRWAVFRTVWFAKKRGERRPKPKRKRLAVFFGPDAECCARQLVAHSMALTKPKPRQPSVLYRSLTTAEWLRAQQKGQ